MKAVNGMDAVLWVVLPVASYFLGNIEFGVMVAKLAGDVDIRQYGSGNVGATNVARTMGPLYSALTLLGDAGKGALATALGLWLLGVDGAMLCGLLTVLGHNWPVLHRFKGGKGIAASLGTVLVVAPYLGLGLLVVFVILMLIIKTVSIGSLTGLYLGLFYGLVTQWGNWAFIGYLLLLCAMGTISHRENIMRIAKGEEKALTFGSMEELKQKTREAKDKTVHATKTATRKAGAALRKVGRYRIRMPRKWRSRRPSHREKRGARARES